MRKDTVFLTVCLGYVGGVFVGSFFDGAWWIFIGLCAAWIALYTAFPRASTFLLLFPIIFFAFGHASVLNSVQQFRTEIAQSQKVSGIARVMEDPEEKNLYRQIILRMESCETRCPREKILWQAPRTNELVTGARVLFSCVLAPPQNYDDAFDYRMYLAKDNIGYVCRQADDASGIEEDMRARLTRVFFLPKHALARALEQSLPQPEAGLAEGLILGGDNRLSQTFKQIFVVAGLSHIVAISGYNIALIAQGFVLLGVGIGLWRRQALWFAAVGIILFIIVVGAPASAVRAGIMGLSLFVALFWGRLSLSVNILLGAATLMLMFQPLLLRYDVGFQLSFLAAFAIIMAMPFMAHFLPKEFFGKSLVEIAFLTGAVELFVVPLIAYQFHSISSFALVANILLLPLVPYAMAAAFFTGLAFFILPGLHVLPAALAYFFLHTITLTAEYISTWPLAILSVEVSSTTLVLWYASLFFGIVIGKPYRGKYVRSKNIS